MKPNALVYFIKAPILGKVKTRLAKQIGEHRALEFYEECVRKLVNLPIPLLCDVCIAYDTPKQEEPLPSYLQGFSYFYQEGENLGERMRHAFEHLFAQGYKRVVLVGSDIPAVDAKILSHAITALSTNDAIVSPTLDGGYYLIGFHAHTFRAEAFEGISYSQKDVFAKTKAKLKGALLTHGKTLRDIDTLEDLKAYDKTFKTKRISVIIPVYHEDEILLQTIETLYQNASAKDFEVIIVDTHECTTIDKLPFLSGVRIGYAEKGRASQMNEGANMAEGDILLFLHADTLLPKGWDKLICTNSNAGAFKLSIQNSKPIFKCIAFFANLRSAITNIPYGDQALFFKTSLFKTLGGYANISLMEDVEIMKRLKHHDEKVTILDAYVQTSSRRWEKEGVFYTTLRNRMLSFLYMCGISVQKLKAYYKENRS